MKANDFLKTAGTTLATAGVATSRLDCLILLEDVTGKDRAWLLAHNEFELSDKQVTRLDALVARRAQHEPLSYLRQKTEFYGREFYVNRYVLEPRPESETMIELLKRIAEPTATIFDIGTGSGALAITAKLELPNTEVYASDAYHSCLAVAAKNATKLKAEIGFFRVDLIKPLVDVAGSYLLCNLPYVPESHTINEAAMFEPKVAIFGGADGLDLYRKLFQQIHELGEYPKCILAESLPFQHPALSLIAAEYGYKQAVEDDFIQVFKRLNA